MRIEKLKKYYDQLHEKYGAKELKSIYGAGCLKSPEICFIFMNPTGKNIASIPEWEGIRAPWIGTKNIWKLFNSLDLIDKDIYLEILSKKPNDWDISFAAKVYKSISDNNIYITNLGKCTQIDARPLANKIFKDYLQLLYKEIDAIKPKKIITFGNQVSSIFLGQNICVSKCRKKEFIKNINNKKYKVFPIYYPIGNGMRNIDIAVEDLKYIIKTN